MQSHTAHTTMYPNHGSGKINEWHHTHPPVVSEHDERGKKQSKATRLPRKQQAGRRIYEEGEGLPGHKIPALARRACQQLNGSANNLVVQSVPLA
jgi:hypothetical protein